MELVNNITTLFGGELHCAIHPGPKLKIDTCRFSMHAFEESRAELTVIAKDAASPARKTPR
jgi:hypothetical protein